MTARSGRYLYLLLRAEFLLMGNLQKDKRSYTTWGMNMTSEELEIDLIELMYRLLEKAKLIILVAIAGAIIAGVITFQFMTPTYTATSKLYVLNSKDSALSLSDLQIGTQLASDYIEVFSNWHVHEMVIQRLGLDTTYTELDKRVSVSNPSGTRILYIKVNAESPEAAKDLADTYALVAQEFIAAKMETEMPNVFEEALTPSKPSSPNKTRNVILGFLLGAVLACGIVVVQFLTDDRIRTSESLEKYLNMPTLGMMPATKGNEVSKKRKNKGGAAKA